MRDRIHRINFIEPFNANVEMGFRPVFFRLGAQENTSFQSSLAN